MPLRPGCGEARRGCWGDVDTPSPTCPAPRVRAQISRADGQGGRSKPSPCAPLPPFPPTESFL